MAEGLAGVRSLVGGGHRVVAALRRRKLASTEGLIGARGLAAGVVLAVTV